MTNILTLLNLLVTLGVIAGTITAYLHGFARTEEQIQERVIKALQSELDTLKDRLTALEEENTRLNHVITTIRTALKRRGLFITIDREMVSIRDPRGVSTHISGSQPSEADQEGA